jgi:PAS domain S-box-containing protein
MEKAEEQPRSAAELQATLNVIPAYTWYAAPSGALTFVNKRTADYLGLPEDHPLRFGIDNGAQWDAHIPLLHPDEQEESRKAWSICLRTGEAGEFSFRVRNAQGDYRWFLSRAEPLRASDGTLLQWVGVNLDIEELKHTEQALRESEYKLRQIIETVPSLLWSAGPDGGPIHVSQRVLDYSGMRLEEFQRGGWEAFVHPADFPETAKAFYHAIQTGTSYQAVHRLRRAADGEYRWHHARGEPLRDRKGRIIQWYGLSVDIDEAKRAEDRLRRSEALLAEAERLNHSGASAANESTVLYFSEESYRIWGFDPALGIPSPEAMFQRVHPDDRNRVRASAERALSEKRGYSHGYRIVLPDGTVKHLESIREPVFSPSEELIEIVSTQIDVTERKRAETALREREARLAEAQRELQVMIDTIPVMVASYDADGSLNYINKTALDFTGVAEVDMAERQRIMAHPDDFDQIRSQWRATVAKGEPFETERRLRRRDGEYRWISTRRVPLRDSSGKIVRWYSAAVDIEDRKRAELALKKSEAELIEAKRELQQTIDTIPIIVARYSPNGERNFVNAAWKQFTGLSDEAARSMGLYFLVHPDDVADVERKSLEALAKGESLHIEARLRRADGEYRWRALDRVARRDEAGNISNWYGVSYDIEDRKRAEDALRRSRAYLDEAQRLSATGSVGWRIADNLIVWSQETYRIFELDPVVKPTRELMLGRTHPDDIELVRGMTERLLNEDRDFDYEHRLLLSDGTIRYLHVRTHRVRFESGEMEVVGAVMDITAARKAEEALRRAQAELAHASRVATLGELSASIAHEVHQPLTAIVASGNAAVRWLDREIPERARAIRSITRMISEAHRASQVILRIRELAKKAEPVMSQVDVNSLVADVLMLINREATGQRVEVRTQLALKLPPALGDRVQLQQVLINLAMNGIQAMVPVTDRTRVLVIRTRRHDADRILVAVEDAGIGIESENLDRLFGAFYTTKPDGMGMGLSISRSIVEAHGGSISATRNSGAGMTFRFTLSLYREQAAASSPIS